MYPQQSCFFVYFFKERYMLLVFLLREENMIEIAPPTGQEIAASDKRQHIMYCICKGLGHCMRTSQINR